MKNRLSRKSKRSYFVDPFKCIVSLITSIVSLILTTCMFIINRPVSAFIFIIITLIFVIMLTIYGAKIIIQENGIKRTILGRTTHFFLWNEIMEVGIAGTRVFHSKNKKNTGTLYIYIDKQEMTETERFEMMLNWPPKNKMYLQHTKKRMDFIQKCWGGKIQTWNVGDLKI